MISPHLRFEGFDVRSWTNLVSLFESDTPSLGTLVFVVDKEDHLLLANLGGRPLDDLGATGWPEASLEELKDRFDASRVLVVREGTPDEITERLSLRLHRGEDYVSQWISLVRIVREAIDAGQIRIYPRPLGSIPTPSPTTVRRALDVVLPNDRSLLVALWDRDKLATCFAIRRRQGAIDMVAGPDLICRWAGPLGGDFRRDHRVLINAVSDGLGPTHLGVFAEMTTMRKLLRAGKRGSWAKAVATRDVILYPAPPYAAVALGADAVRGAAAKAARFLGGLDAVEALMPLANAFRSRVSDVASVTATLGFNPMTVLATILNRADEEGDTPTGASDARPGLEEVRAEAVAGEPGEESLEAAASPRESKAPAQS